MIKRIAVAFLIFFCLAGCRSSKKTSSSSSQSAKHADILDDETYKLTAVSEDDTYAFSERTLSGYVVLVPAQRMKEDF